MSQDLLTQLADYGTYCEERQGSVLADDVIGNVAPLPEPTLAHSPGSRRGWLVAAGAAALTLILVGGAAWLARSDGTVEPATPTTTLAPPETTPSTLIPAPPPESLNQSQIQAQAGFLAAFREGGFLTLGVCRRPEGGPSECTVQIDSPTLGGPASRTFPVPQAFTMPDSMQTSLTGAAVREVAEEGLAALYVWGHETYPEETAARCGVGFEGDDTAVAWSPGYTATTTCGEHLAGLLAEFNPAEAPEAPRELEQPDPSAGLWSRVDPATPNGAPPSWVLFDVAETPVGLLATGVDGLWISQDAIEWRPYARDSVDFDGGFSKIAVSDLGIVVSGPGGDARTALWFSPDGESWTPIDRWRNGLAVSGNGLTASDERFLLINYAQPSGYRVMSSTDGTNWQFVEELEAWDFYLVEATPFGFFAASRDGGVWTSPDGVEWTDLSNRMLGAEPNDIAGSQSGLVAVTGDGRILHSPDGALWTDVHSLTPAEDWERACTRVGASEIGFLVVAVHVGHVDSWPDSWDDVDSAVPTAWFSEDGRAWVRVATAPLGDTQEHGYVCQNEVIPYESGFLSVTDNQLANQDPHDMVWLYER